MERGEKTRDGKKRECSIAVPSPRLDPGCAIVISNTRNLS